MWDTHTRKYHMGNLGMCTEVPHPMSEKVLFFYVRQKYEH